MARKIIRDVTILGGRWHFEGTRIPIAAIRADALVGADALIQVYQAAGLTESEILLALNFTFPEVREPELRTQYAAVTVVCACGEESHSTVSGFDRTEIMCVCGRCWGLQLTLDPLERARSASS